LSVVPNELLKPVESEELILFPIEDRANAAAFDVDTWTQYRSFWRSSLMRNLHTTLNLSYRVRPNDALRSIPPLSERTILGWGSFFHVEQGGTPDYEIDMLAVTWLNAQRVQQ